MTHKLYYWQLESEKMGRLTLIKIGYQSHTADRESIFYETYGYQADCLMEDAVYKYYNLRIRC